MKSWNERRIERAIKISKAISNFLTDGGMYLVFGVGIAAIIMQIVSFHAKNGFDWMIFLLLEVPLYSFCIWALWQAWKMFKNTLKLLDENEKRKQKNSETKEENN